MNGLNIENTFSRAKEQLDLLDVSSENMDERSFYDNFDNLLNLPFRQPILLTEMCFYRSRLASSINDCENLTDITTYSYIPLNKVSANFPSRGRMNKTGQSMFYASLTPDTNYLEIKNDIKEGEVVYISKWKIKNNKTLSVFPVCLSENVNTEADINKCIAITSEYFTDGIIGEYIRKLCDLFTRTEKDIKQRYLASSFLSNYILNQTGIAEDRLGNEYSFQYDGVVYPSARIGNGNIRNSNIVIKSNVVDEKLELVYVLKGYLKSDLSSLFVEQIGFYENDKINWYLFKPYDVFAFADVYIQYADNLCPLGTNLVKDAEEKIVTPLELNSFLNKQIRNDDILKALENNGLAENQYCYNQINMKEDLMKNTDLVGVIPVDGWTIVIAGEIKRAKNIVFTISLKNYLMKL